MVIPLGRVSRCIYLRRNNRAIGRASSLRNCKRRDGETRGGWTKLPLSKYLVSYSLYRLVIDEQRERERERKRKSWKIETPKRSSGGSTWSSSTGYREAHCARVCHTRGSWNGQEDEYTEQREREREHRIRRILSPRSQCLVEYKASDRQTKDLALLEADQLWTIL